jgi:hypothetical protein
MLLRRNDLHVGLLAGFPSGSLVFRVWITVCFRIGPKPISPSVWPHTESWWLTLISNARHADLCRMKLPLILPNFQSHINTLPSWRVHTRVSGLIKMPLYKPPDMTIKSCPNALCENPKQQPVPNHSFTMYAPLSLNFTQVMFSLCNPPLRRVPVSQSPGMKLKSRR